MDSTQALNIKIEPQRNNTPPILSLNTKNSNSNDDTTTTTTDRSCLPSPYSPLTTTSTSNQRFHHTSNYSTINTLLSENSSLASVLYSQQHQQLHQQQLH